LLYQSKIENSPFIFTSSPALLQRSYVCRGREKIKIGP
jgi:hypothetical protein